MTTRTTPDANQAELEEAINAMPGCQFIDTHDVPYNLPELTGFPDGLVVNENAVTIFCNDPAAVFDAIQKISGISVWYGGIVPVEIKTAAGVVRKSQSRWAEIYGVKQVILRTIDDVLAMFNSVIRR